MLTLSKEQVAKFINAEDEAYVTQIRQRILVEHSELVENEHNLHKRLKKAYLDLIAMGFKNEALIRSYLYFVAFNHDFHGSSEIQNMLNTGDSPEQQYRDYLRVMDNLLKRKN
ncbi:MULTISPECIES: hypothetical protein [Photorhabdus]|uniref:Uncharacterized protein n=2 Tax=Photorhabdus asymbiotica TaxID=291112 RepID=B6VLN9_PHOAA|nr:hypothetical protein [Photorhabdus asymbiotica]RKS60026.1 hypothetical protein BDD30_2141 [Photorhabdus asymbiotica]CAQ86184.1 conserved hypothetical protein [Photorhabdus asymbiotica]CAR67069.1 Conserved Hypothetical Protein [Photorhabdus asymbiotica subsp. asymbiotica ATCC 43949]